MRKIIALVGVLFLVACSSSKKVTPKKVYKKPKTVRTQKEVKTTPSPKVVKEVKQIITETEHKAKSNLSAVTVAYVEKYAPMAMDEMRKFRIPASITLAQGILESGSGKSQLSSKSNNHFGIKCHKGWTGARVYHDDDAKGECFRKYKYPSTSYQDHSLFLSTRFRYASLFKLRQDDYKGWAKGLKKAGYATDPKYPKKLISYIEKYQLYKYDDLVLKGKIRERDIVTEEVYEEAVLQEKPVATKGTYLVKREDTLYSIARRYHISVESIKRLNNMTDNTIHEGDRLILSGHGKRMQQSSVFHVVQPKETLYSISRKFSTTIASLKELNNLKSNDLSIGQRLRVK